MRIAIGAVGESSGTVGAGDLHFFSERGFELDADVFVFLEEDPGIFAALTHAFAGIADPGAGFF